MKVTLSPDVLFQELDEESVLLNLQNEHYHGLDEVGTRVWQLLAEHGDTEPVMAALLTEYAIEEEPLRQDVERLIGELAARDLVRLEPA